MGEHRRTIVIPVNPPRLKARMEFYKAVMPPFAPLFDRVFIYPLDDADQADTTAGGIVVPQQVKDKFGAQRGIIIAAGPKAIEHLYSGGVGLGDIVYTARFSRWERQYQARDKSFHRVLICTAGEITASQDLFDDFEKGDLWYELDVEEGTVTVHDRENTRERNDPPPRDYGV